ncbi:MAG: hypothetical protein SWH68_01725 [Thermodesulfobacteriota bacterium]|nr:hypothetical protein [Thermodesulfobacteriota bacterium]
MHVNIDIDDNLALLLLEVFESQEVINESFEEWLEMLFYGGIFSQYPIIGIAYQEDY